jgi:regulator of protease activity HflC (stomatin/prohibitin superfamily)
MRTDHIAYQRATRIAGLGLLLQLAIGLTLLIYGSVASDSAMVIGSYYALAGVVVWATLAIVFHQHHLERLETTELEELSAGRGQDAAALFEGDEAESRVAARRLELMHRWLVPGASLLLAGVLGFLSWATLRWFAVQDDPNIDASVFSVGPALGWQLAVSLGLALVAFIFSRFVAGMAKQPAWQNLRGGAAVMVGNALIGLAIAIGLVFTLLQRPAVMESIAYGLAIFLAVVAAEIVLNFILNLYRPRRLGEIPRAAFDSRVLSLLATPDSLVRSINEAINYQFGFDITSSWGYQLLLRSFLWLIGFGAVVLLLLSTIVIVEPGRQAVLLERGRLKGEVHREGVLFKLPWPLERAEIHDVSTIRQISLSGVIPREQRVNLWGQPEAADPDRRPYVVAASSYAGRVEEAIRALDRAGAALDAPDDAELAEVTDQFAVVDADVLVRFRIREDGLLDWLTFSNDTRTRRSPMDMRERALRDLALREVTQFLSTQPLNEVLSPRGDSLVTGLRQRIQRSFDRYRTGVEVVSIAIPRLRPPGEEAGRFEDLSISVQNARKLEEQARSTVNTTMALLIGDAARAAAIVEAIQQLRELERRVGAESEEYLQAQVRVERMLLDARAQTASVISTARARRWRLHMDARRNAETVLGEAPAYRIDPELYQQRRLMQALGEALAGVRMKFVLGSDPQRTRVDLRMLQPDPGLNLADTLRGDE